MSEEQLLVTLGVKDANCTTKVKELNKEIKNLDSIYKTTSSTSKKFESTTQGLSTKLEYLNKKYDATKAKLQAYKEQMTQAQEKISKKKEELEKLKNSEEKNTQAIAKAEKQLQTYQSQLNNATRNVNLTEAELKNLDAQIKDTNKAMLNSSVDAYKKKMKELGETVESAGQKIQTIGGGISSVGGKLMAASAPFVAFSGYATKTAMSFEQDMANLQATSGATGEDFEALTNKAKELGENTCKSASDSAQAMQYLALAGYDVNQILNSTEPILKASVAWGADMATSADLATDSMSALGISTDQLSHYLDVCSQAQRSSNTTATMMMEAYISCGGSLKNLGVPLEESATLIGILANQGLKGSEAGNSLNSILINLTGATSSAKGAFKELGISAWDENGKFIGLEKTLILLNDKLKGCTQEQRNNYLAAIGGKTQIDTLNKLLAGCGDQYNDLSGKINQANGATEEMYSIMNDTAQGKIAAFKSKLEALGIEIGDKILPHLTKLLDKGMELIDWFGNLDEGTQELILKTGLITFASGGVLKVVGGLTTGVGKLVSGGGKLIKTLSNISKGAKVASGTLATTEGAIGTLGSATVTASTASGGLISTLGTLGSTALALAPAVVAVGGSYEILKTHTELANESILNSTDNMSAFKKVIDNIDGGFHKSNEELEEMGIKYKDFSGDVSDEFKQAVEDCSSKIRDFNQQLHETTLDGDLTESETNDLVSRVDKMCQEALATVQSYEDKGKQAMAKAFSADGIVTEDEQKTLDAYGKTFDDAKNIITQKKEENKNLLKQRNEQNYKEIDAQIKKNEEEIGQAQLEIQATNNDEREAMHTNFIERVRNIDAKGASDILTEKKAKLDEANQATHDIYDEGIEILKEQIEKTTGAEQEGYKKQYDNLCSARDRELAKNRENFSQYYNELKENNEKIAENINMITGEIMSEKETRQQNTLLELESHYANLDSITQSGYYQMYNTITGTMDNVAIKIDDSTGQIVGMWEQSTNKCGEAMKGMSNEANNLANTMDLTKASMVDNYMQLANSTVNSSNQMINKNGEVVASLEDVKTHSDGTRTGIVDLNGTPINIKVNENGVISTLDGVLSKMKTISGTEVTLEMRQKLTSDGRGGVYVTGSGYAKGTDNATRGVHLVGEKGPELVFFSGGETVLTADKTRNVLSGGGYFSPRSYESKQLINNTNNSTINNYSNMNFDYDRLANTMANALANIVDRLNKSTNQKTIGNNMSYELVMAQRRLRK